MALKLTIVLGANTFTADGDFDFDEGFAVALRAWINAQQTLETPEAIEQATMRLKAANDATAQAVIDNTPNPGD